MKRFTLLLILTALAGCTSGPGPLGLGDPGGGCATTHATARWQDRAAYDALAGPVPPGYSLHAEQQESGLSGDHPRLRELAGEVIISRVLWTDGNGSVEVVGWHGDTLQLTVRADPAERARALATMVEALGLADSRERPAWERIVQRSSEVYLPAPAHAPPFLDELHDADANLTVPRVGSAWLTWGAWNVTVQRATRAVSLGTPGTTGTFHLSVDSEGQAVAAVPVVAHEEPAATVRRFLDERLPPLGVTPPLDVAIEPPFPGCPYRPSSLL